eukprot:gene24655-29789_t
MKFLSKLLQPKNAVKAVLLVRDIAVHLKQTYEGAELHASRFQPSFILHIMRIVEVEAVKVASGTRFDKRQAVLDIVKQLIPNVTAPDLVTIGCIIDDLHASGQVTAPSSAKAVKKLVLSYFKK